MSSSPTSPTRPAAGPARLAILLACLWVGLGASFKLVSATPMDIPPVVRGFTLRFLGLDAAETYRFAITIELSIVALALLVPRKGWLLLAAQYAVFLVVLAAQMASGATSCGCFGGTVTLAPWQMAAIDLPLLLFLLLSRPHQRLPEATPRPTALLALVAAVVLAALAPFHFLKTGGGPPPSASPGAGAQDVATAGTQDEGPATPPIAEGPEEAGVDTADVGEGTDTTPLASGPTEAVPAAPELPDFVELRPSEWAGQTPDALDLFAWSIGGADNGALLPPPCHVVVYRRSCDVCATHLQGLALEPLPDGRPIVLVRIPEVDESVASAVEMKPEAFMEIELHALNKGYGVTTPWAFDVSAEFLVENVQDLSAH